jgi:hypothetical protein
LLLVAGHVRKHCMTEAGLFTAEQSLLVYMAAQQLLCCFNAVICGDLVVPILVRADRRRIAAKRHCVKVYKVDVAAGWSL